MKFVFASALLIATTFGTSTSNSESYLSSEQWIQSFTKGNFSDEFVCGCQITGCESGYECRVTWEGDGNGCIFRCMPKSRRLFD